MMHGLTNLKFPKSMNIHELEVLAMFVGHDRKVYVVLRLYVSCYDVGTQRWNRTRNCLIYHNTVIVDA